MRSTIAPEIPALSDTLTMRLCPPYLFPLGYV
jgi:hypothetical protein